MRKYKRQKLLVNIIIDGKTPVEITWKIIMKEWMDDQGGGE